MKLIGIILSVIFVVGGGVLAVSFDFELGIIMMLLGIWADKNNE